MGCSRARPAGRDSLGVVSPPVGKAPSSAVHRRAVFERLLRPALVPGVVLEGPRAKPAAITHVTEEIAKVPVMINSPVRIEARILQASMTTKNTRFAGVIVELGLRSLAQAPSSRRIRGRAAVVAAE